MDLLKYGIKNSKNNWNLTYDELEKITLENEQGKLDKNGALAINTGEFTGRSPQDRFIVKDEITEDKIWWGKVNIPFETNYFDVLYNDVVSYLSDKELYIHDAAVCADDRFKLNVRTITEFAWSNIFVSNMFLRLSESELIDFKEDWLVINAPNFKADPVKHNTRQHNFSILNFTKKIALIGGSAYTGEMKKGIFSALNFLLPEQKVLPMHCSANVGDDGVTSIFFGLSGTGKTTLSADPNRKLIGDDEHGWTKDNVIFNFEGGCYAKVIDLTEEKEPDIFQAIKKGALLENVVFKNNSNEVDFLDSSITQNTRVSYPIEHIHNIVKPSLAKHPKHIFFLTADAFGVLPPISKLTPGQAAYHFISGYTAKVAGTEAGVTEPVPAFSACFGSPFMPLHPTVYAGMLSDKMKENNVEVWLVNTGWSGGEYGIGSRIKLKYTRAMITSIMKGALDNVAFEIDPFFGLHMPKECPEVPSEILNPMNTWQDKSAYIKKAIRLSSAFHINFEKYEKRATKEMLFGGPVVAEHHHLDEEI